MYFRIADEGDGNVYLGTERGENSSARTMIRLGLELAADDFTVPFRFTMSVEEDEEARLDDWFVGPCLMREELVAALRAAGVTNLVTYPAEIKREDGGELVPGYVVANLVGTVSCPRVATRGDAPGVAYAFDYEVDPARAGDKLLFRISEIESFIIAHERVADLLRARKSRGVAIVSLAEAPRAAGT